IRSDKEPHMSSRWCMRLLRATVAGLLLASTAALADPSARVARISFIGGAVSFRPASLDEWSATTVNYPLTIGDHARHDQEQQASEASQRAQVRQRHQQEMKALRAPQKQERDATQKRQQAERKKKGSDPR